MGTVNATASLTVDALAAAVQAKLAAAGTLIPSQALTSPVTARNPRFSDDATRGYAVGNFWNAPSSGLFQATGVSRGLAVWAPYTAGVGLPLDVVGTALAAYGTTRLRAAYAGYAIRVLRASDSTTLDVGFLSSGALDTVSLDAFLVGTTGRVVIWYDQSGNGRDATATTSRAPAIYAQTRVGNSRSIMFDSDPEGTPQIPRGMTMPAGVAAASNAMSIVGVGRWHNSRPGQAGNIIYGEMNGSPQMGLFINSTQALVVQNNGARLAFGVYPSDHPSVFGWAYGASTSRLFIGATSASFGAPSNIALAGGTIGGDTAQTYTGFCEFGAWIVYGRQISATEQANLQASLASTFGLAPQTRDTLMFLGDSITEGRASTFFQGYPDQVQPQLVLPMRVFNCARSGQTAATTDSLYAGIYATNYRPGAQNNVLFVLAGTNDINNINNFTGAQAWASIQSILTKARATGFKTVVATILPVNPASSSTTLAERINLNNLIYANWTTYADALCDFAADPIMGPLNAPSDTTLYADLTHPTNLGYSIMAPRAAAAINSLLSTRVA